MSGLQLLSAYSSDTDSSEDGEKCSSPKRKKLPLPSNLNLNVDPEVSDDPSLHGGRNRRYPHQRGNWSSLIYVPYVKSESFDVFCEHIIEMCLPEVKLNKIDDPHISLSKTFILYYHWIKEFCFSLRDKLKVMPCFEINFNGIGIYCNEDLSRTFFALTVGTGSREISSCIDIIDDCLMEYKLDPYYEEASFHMSIAWCLGNKKQILEQKLTDFIKVFELFKGSSDFSLVASHFLLKAGFKEFKLDLNQ